jgi:hypothetical protein
MIKNYNDGKKKLITNGNIKGLLPPEKNNQLDSIAYLINIATKIIFTATAQHSAVNFAQYDYAGWITILIIPLPSMNLYQIYLPEMAII